VSFHHTEPWAKGGAFAKPLCAVRGTGSPRRRAAYRDFLTAYDSSINTPCAKPRGTLAGVTLGPGVYCFPAAAGRGRHVECQRACERRLDLVAWRIEVERVVGGEESRYAGAAGVETFPDRASGVSERGAVAHGSGDGGSGTRHCSTSQRREARRTAQDEEASCEPVRGNRQGAAKGQAAEAERVSRVRENVGSIESPGITQRRKGAEGSTSD